MSKKKQSIKSLRQKLDKVFSHWIRKRGADEGGTNNCVTCGVLKHWTELQCGHWHSRRHLGTRWDEQNCHPQCPACNVFKSGNYTEYAKFMYAKFSPKEIEALMTRAYTTTKLTREYYEQMIEKYRGS